MDRRIWEHPVLQFRRGPRITFYFEGEAVEAYMGETIGVALWASGIKVLGYSRVHGEPRGLFCMIGKCASCLVEVDGIPNIRSCIEPVRPGIHVRRQENPPRPPSKTEPVVEPGREEELETDLLVVGGGPAGLAAALEAARHGLSVVLVDEHHRLGGQMVKQTHKFFGSNRFFGGLRGFQVAEEMEKMVLGNKRIRVIKQATVFGIYRGGVVGIYDRAGNKVIRVYPGAVVASTGAEEKPLAFPGNTLIGVMGAGGAQTLMNEYGVKPGDRAVIVGSGNVGLIVAYQLLQAGVRVEALLEILPFIGGWFVHAAKLRRMGVPILTRHTVKEAIGRNGVLEKVVAVMVDEKYRPVPGSEKVFDADLLLLAVGLQPDARLHAQAGAVMKYVPEAGGFVPLRTRMLETSVPGLYVAGDASGIEEATSAIIEGWIAGAAAAYKLRGNREAMRRVEELNRYLWDEYRAAPVMSRSRAGKMRVTVSEEEMEMIRRRNPPRVSFPAAR